MGLTIYRSERTIYHCGREVTHPSVPHPKILGLGDTRGSLNLTFWERGDPSYIPKLWLWRRDSPILFAALVTPDRLDVRCCRQEVYIDVLPGERKPPAHKGTCRWENSKRTGTFCV